MRRPRRGEAPLDAACLNFVLESDCFSLRRRERQALWASFQASVSSELSNRPSPLTPKMVKIEKRFRFAGEEVVYVPIPFFLLPLQFPRCFQALPLPPLSPITNVLENSFF